MCALCDCALCDADACRVLQIDHGHGEQQRAVLDQRKSQLVAQLQAHVQGLRQLDKHMAQLQHRYGSMLVQAPPTQGAPPAHNGALVELRNQIQATAHHHATAIKQHTMLEGQLAHADVLLAMLSQCKSYEGERILSKCKYPEGD